MSEISYENHRLCRIAQEICECDLTDGFCTPSRDPTCKCWRYARLAIQGLRRQADPCLKDAWPTFTVDASRMMLIKLCDAVSGKTERL